MAGHTKGPWTATGEVSNVSGTDLWCGEIYPANAVKYLGTVANVQSCDHISGISQEEAAANARLIAAAPDLLAALERARVAIWSGGDTIATMAAIDAAMHLAKHGAAPATTNEEAV